MDKIACTKCQTRLRYPLYICNNGHMQCKECSTHLIIRQGDQYTPDCKARVKEATYLNKFIKGDVKDECQYGCGVKGAPLDLGKHEQECSQRGNNVQCLYKDCKWRGYPKPLIFHCIEKHRHAPPVIISLCKNRDFKIHPGKSPQLVLQYNENATTNFIYWAIMRKIKNKTYITVMNAGKFGNVDCQHELSRYTIDLIRDETTKSDTIISIKSLIENKINLQDPEQFDAFLKRPALKLLVPNQADYNITIPVPELKYQEEAFCQVCNKLLRNMTKCCDKPDVLHLICNDCAKKHKNCACCHRIIEAQLPCSYVDHGCIMRGTSKIMAAHEMECVHRYARCVLCPWIGEKRDLKKHCITHGSFSLCSLYALEKLHKTYTASYIFESQYFVMQVLVKAELRFIVFHITDEDCSEYMATVRFQNRNTRYLIEYKFHCQLVKAEDYKNNTLENLENCHMLPTHVLAKLKTNRNKLYCSLNLVHI